MSLISRTPSRLFAKLRRSNPEDVAIEFVQECRDDSFNLNVQLTDLILRCCGVFRFIDQVPYELVRNEDIAEIVKLVRDICLNLASSVREHTFVECLNRALKFFDRFWLLTWNDSDDEEESFIEKLLLALTDVPANTIQFLCARIRSKYVTSVLKNRPTNFELRMTRLCKRADKVMTHGFFFKNRALLKLHLREFEQWLKLRPADFTTENFLRFVIWSLKDETADVRTLALEILEQLLTNDPENLPERFVRQCGLTMSALDIPDSDEIFALICSCCVKLRRLSRENVVPSDVEEKLYDQLYSPDEKKWHTAADYWVATHYDVNPVQYLRNAIKSAAVQRSGSSTLKYAEYFVDSLIDKCAVLTQWSLCVDVLVGGHRERLTEREKQTLLVLIVFAARRVTLGQRPKLRVTDEETLQVGEVNEVAAKDFTSAFLPHVWEIFKAGFAHPALRLELVTYFHFDSIPSETKKRLIRTCEFTFRDESASFTERKIITKLLRKIKTDSNDFDVKDSCLTGLDRMKKFVEARVRKAMDEFFYDPVQPIRNRKLSDDLLILRIVVEVLPVEKDVAYDFAWKVLKCDSPEAVWHPEFVAVRECCVLLAVRYIERILSESFIVEDDRLKVVYEDALRLGIWCSALLSRMGNKDLRAGVSIFLCICDIARLMKRADATKLLPDSLLKNLRLYILRAFPALTQEYQRDLMSKYLEAIDQDILPMEYAYDALTVHCNHPNDDKCERLLQRFLEAQCEKRGTPLMTNWMTAMWRRVYEVEFNRDKRGTLRFCEKLCELVYPIRSKLRNVLYECHVEGIDYAASDAKYSEFAQILSTFSICLRAEDKPRVLEHLVAKPLTDHMTAFQGYIRSLREKTFSFVIDESVSVEDTSSEDFSRTPIRDDDSFTSQ